MTKAEVRRAVYCRAPSAVQKHDLASQRRVLEEFAVARVQASAECIEEVGGDRNFRRNKFLSMMDDISRLQVKVLVLAHQDRLTRFGYEWFEHQARIHGCETPVLDQEMIQDLITITHDFSA